MIKSFFNKLIILSIISIVLVGCSSNISDQKADPPPVDNGNKVEDDEKTYGLDEWWEVENLWRLKIDSIRFTDERNEFSDEKANEVIVIKYTYENLGFEGELQDLYIVPTTVIDGAGKKANGYPAGENVYAEPTPIGETMEGAEESFNISTTDGEVTVIFEEYDQDYNLYKAEFIISLPEN